MAQAITQGLDGQGQMIGQPPSTLLPRSNVPKSPGSDAGSSHNQSQSLVLTQSRHYQTSDACFVKLITALIALNDISMTRPRSNGNNATEEELHLHCVALSIGQYAGAQIAANALHKLVPVDARVTVSVNRDGERITIAPGTRVFYKGRPHVERLQEWKKNGEVLWSSAYGHYGDCVIYFSNVK